MASNDAAKPAKGDNEVAAGILPDRARPNAPTVEKAVLAAMLREPEICVDQVIELLGQQDVFYVPAHKEIYQAIKELHTAPGSRVDLISLAQMLSEQKKLEAIGGELFLADLADCISTTVNLENWCGTLRKYAMLRKMIDACSTALIKCYDLEVDASKLVEQIETDIYNVRSEESSNSVRAVSDLVHNEFLQLMDIADGKHESGIRTGFAPIDDCTGGLKPGEMFVLAARPSIGKTSLAMNVITNIAMKRPDPRPVAFFSLEMTAEQITRRMLCCESEIPEQAFWNQSFSSDDLVKLTGAAERIRNAKIYIDPTAGLTISELRAKARRLKMQYHIEMIAIDYLQLMHSDGRSESRQQEVAEISAGIKKLAKDLQIPVLVLAQLNREVDKASGNGPGSRPKLAHLRESGTIEQDADVVSFLHRDREATKGATGGSFEAEWIIEKNRNGRTGNFKLLFYPTKMEFVAASPCSEEFAPQN